MPIASLSDFNRDDAGGSDGASGKNLPPYGPGGIYHEKQVASMCAVHAVNNMLQGPLFEYSDFGAVAQQLDREEARITGDLRNDGGNMRADGFFNVQVLKMVLQRAGYDMIRAGDKANGLDPKQDTAKETAFILNKREHWFSVRRIGAEWFDLNSCIKTPNHYTPGDLRFHINDAIKEGYEVFVVRGDFPKSALENDSKKLVEAVQGCGRPGQGYSLFAGGGQTIGGSGASSAAPAANDAAALRAARLAALERRAAGGNPDQPPGYVAAAPAVPSPAPAAAPAAAPPSKDIQQMMEMGFERSQCEAALSRANGNLQAALEALLSG